MKMTDADTMARGRLLVLDAETLAVETAVDIEIGRHPAHVIIDAQSKRHGMLMSELINHGVSQRLA